MKVAELQKVLKNLNLPYSGRKDALLERIGWAEFSLLDSEIFEDQSLNQLNPGLENEPWLLLKKTSGPVYARIPKASREQSCRLFTKLLNKVISLNDKESWEKFLNFARYGLGSSSRGGRHHTSQATLINKRLKAYDTGQIIDEQQAPRKKAKSKSTLANQVSAKLALGDVKGAVNLVTSRESVLTPSNETLLTLKIKHPPRNNNNQIPMPELVSNSDSGCFTVCKADVKLALSRFKKGAAGGPDGLRPQHLLDMTGLSVGEPGEKLVESIVDFINLILLPGKVPKEVLPTFFGANLTALKKPDGGTRPVAVGLTIRRLAAKIFMNKLKSFCENEFRPNQMGVGTPNGCEAAVHVVRTYVESDDVQDQVLLKIDFSNAFNSVHRDVVLKLVMEKLPFLYPFVYQCYGEQSKLFFGEYSLDSAEGVQQGDPMGPFLFSLATIDVTKSMKSNLNLWYLDDGTIAGNVKTVLQDYNNILKALDSHGLQVNPRKCEIFLIKPQSKECKNALEAFQSLTEGVKLVEKEDLMLLGAPIFPEALGSVLESKLDNLELMAQRLKEIDSHTALFLLKNCFAMPKLTYLLRASPSFIKNDVLNRYDTGWKSEICRQ